MDTFSGTIVTLGGGGFSTAGRVTALDDAVLRLTGTDRPRVRFVPTASGNDHGGVALFERALGERAETSVLSLVPQSNHESWTSDPHHVLEQDVIYVGGGSTADLLAIWRLHDLPDLLREAAANGTVLAGIGAGMNCWFEASAADSFALVAPLDDGLGFLPGSACPHLDSEDGRAEKFRNWVAAGTLPHGHGVDDHVALVWRDGVVVDAIAERPGHAAIRVSRAADDAATVRLPVRLLGDAGVLTVSSLLYTDDAMGLREAGAPSDEYDIEARKLVDELRAAAPAGRTAPVIAERLHSIFVGMFSADMVPSPERFRDVAAQISRVPLVPGTLSRRERSGL